MQTVSINNDQRLYIIPCGKGYTCLGFDVCEKWVNDLAQELNVPRKGATIGTLDAYNEYLELCNIAQNRNQKIGWRSKTQLTPELIGLEGKKVEVVTNFGERKRFIVGKSTGFIPCHLELLRKNSSDGFAVSGAPFKSVKVIHL